MQLNELISTLRDLLYPHLGTIAPSGIKAIALEPGLAQGTSCSGLLCTVQRVPQGIATEVTNGKFLDYQWVIRLTQYDKTQSIDKALRSIQESSSFRIKEVVILPQTSTSYEQCRIVIWDPSLIRY